VEACDDVDSDCDGDAHRGWVYTDADGDGTGDPATGGPGDVCSLAGEVTVATDCDDSDPSVGAPTEAFVDTDGDGVGGSTVVVACPTGGAVRVDGDCDDADDSVHPGAPEVCDGVDQDCDSTIDEGTTVALYPDEDGDGVGADSAPVEGCDGLAGHVTIAGDCDDTDRDVTWCESESESESEPEPGCGCQTGAAPAVGWLAAALTALLRRRRAGTHRGSLAVAVAGR
jgi:uncharacterized protein (TIGR03382 family)